MERHYSSTLFILFVSLNALRFSSCEETSEAIVNVKQGALKGRVVDNVGGGQYYAFQGIPYATPPLGQLRFKAPLPPDSWEGTLDATKDGQNCLQGTASGSEDCLFLNVYTPEAPANIENLKPVMVWIHGGAFKGGSGDKAEFGPDHLIREDVIIVTINYRLGLLGFLSLDDPNLDAPGNAGLKDQVMALKWVQENIVNFGGNPEDVTIFGESAGGASVHLLVLSPLAEGLFHKAIVQSSPSLEMLVYRESNCFLKLLTVLNITEADNAEALQILRELPADELLEAQNEVDGSSLATPKCYFPSIETASQEPTLLTDHPLSIIKSGDYNKVPVVFGFNSREGMVMWTEVDNLLSTTYDDLVPYQLGLPKGSNESRKVAEEIRKFYFGGKELSSEVSNELILFLSDTHFLFGMYKSVVTHLQNIGNDMFLYRFSVDGKLNMLKRALNIDAPGAAHADELGYLFVNEGITADIIPNGLEDLTIQRMVKLWTNFARYGNPNPSEASDLINVTWQPVEEDGLNFLEIGENLTVGVNPEYIRMKFWDYILNEVLVSYSK